MVYFAQNPQGGPIKIGYSANVDARIPQLEAWYKRPLVLLATMEGGRRKERQIHKKFAHLRLGRTEQFRPADELSDFIGRPFFVDQRNTAIEEIEPFEIPCCVNIRLHPDLHQAFANLAHANGQTVSSRLRLMIKRDLEQARRNKSVPSA